MSTAPCLLVLNAGSSSLKFSLFEIDRSLACILSGSIDRVGSARSTFTLKTRAGTSSEINDLSAPNHVEALRHVLARTTAATAGLVAVGHRIVHGGPRYRAPQRVDDAMLEELRRVSDFDPEHLPSEIALVEVIAKEFPTLPQIACFDTAFHETMPRVARIIPIPRRYEAMGVQRYGFHGLSYESLLHELAAINPTAASGRVILAHLGNGASMAAVRAGESLDTTMSLTPAAGLPMSSRSGDLDPGLSAFMARHERMSAAQFDRMVNKESGLLGVSETSADMRDLLAIEAEDVRAAEAIALFCYQAKKCIGAYAAVLGGVDTVVFSGGIGERAAPIRERICEGLAFLGIEVDPLRNVAHAPVISANTSRVTVRIVHTNEELMIARSVSRVLGLHSLSSKKPP